MSEKFENFNKDEMDMLREIGNIGAGNAATALAKMINKKVDMEVPKVKVMEFKEVAEMFGGAELPVVGLFLKLMGELQGSIMLILENASAHALVNILIGKQDNNGDSFDELEMSALTELGNILAGAYMSALSTLTDLNIIPGIPEIAIDMAGAIISVPAIEFGKVGDTVLYIETAFIDGNTKALGDFFLVPDLGSYDVLLKALGAMI